MLFTACGSSDGGDETAATPLGTDSSSTTNTGLPSCGVSGHTMVFSIFGTATAGEDGELEAWMSDPEAEPEARTGASDLVLAYQELGYDILYVAWTPSDVHVGDQPLVDAITVWLGSNGFPVGEGVRVWAPDPGADVSVALIEELTRMRNSGAELDIGYVSNPDAVFPLVTGGLPRDQVFTLGAAGSDGTGTSVPDEDFVAHLNEVQGLDRVCE